jgi:hypothetical protein
MTPLEENRQKKRQASAKQAPESGPQPDMQELQRIIHEAIHAELEPIRAELQTIRAVLNALANGLQDVQAQLESEPLAMDADDQESVGRGYPEIDDEEEDQETTVQRSLPPRRAGQSALQRLQRNPDPKPIILVEREAGTQTVRDRRRKDDMEVTQ